MKALPLIAAVALVAGAHWRPATGAPQEELARTCVQVDGQPDKIVCVCDARACDDLEFEWPREPGQATLLETTRAGRRFQSRPLGHSTGAPPPPSDLDAGGAQIVVELRARRQQILGWGGAFTDAAAINIQSLAAPLADRLLASYFGPAGLQYNFGRVPIGGSDFSPRAYSYDDSPAPDLNLTHWALAPEDLEHKIPVIKRALELASSWSSPVKLFASPWSPPRWMKSNNDFRRGRLIDSDEVYASYAQYLANFYLAYRERGLHFWGATVQNEPGSASLPLYFFNSLQMSAAETVRFVGLHLGPTLERELNFTRHNFKLMVGDDSLGLLNLQAPEVMQDARVQRYVSGLAFHWYLSGLLVPYDMLTRALDATRNTGLEFVMMSEACQGAFLSRKHVNLGDWARGESYAADIIEDLRRQTGAWIDWNLALDLQGGPNWARNFVDAPIVVDARRQTFFKQPMYYALAHFSRLMRPGAFVLDARASGPRLAGVTFVSAHLADTRHVVVSLLNRSSGRRRFTLRVEGARDANNATRAIALDVQLEARSVSSVVVKL